MIMGLPDKERYNFLINAIMSKAIRVKLDIFESSEPYYILTSQNYQELQEIKRLVTELEELDSTTENQINEREHKTND